MADSADREANRALHARLAEVQGRYARLRSDMDDFQRRLAALQVTAESGDGLVRAMVGPRGQLIDLRLDPRAYRSHDPTTLARLIVSTVRDAAGRAADQVEALMAEYFPPGSAAMGFVRDNDFGTLLPPRDLTEGDSISRYE